jgi:hypothetical protein
MRTRDAHTVASDVRVSRRFDDLWLTALASASVLPYAARVRFYSDDWAFLGVLSSAPDGSLDALVRAQVAWNDSLAMRPTQVIYQAVLYRAFGLDPIGYHVVNSLVLVAVVVLLHHVLRSLEVPRGIALAVSALYAVTPSFSTDRFWFAAFGYLLSVALYLLALQLDLRAAALRGNEMWLFKGLSLLALILAAFGYEVVIPVFVLNIVLAEVVSRRVYGRSFASRAGIGTALLFHGTTLAVGAGAAFYKGAVGEGLGIGSSFLSHVTRLAAGASAVHLGTYGVAFPHTLWWSLSHAGAIGVLLGLAVALLTYQMLTRRGVDISDLDRRVWTTLGTAGLAVLVLGYAIFLTTGRIAFSSTGIANRVGVVASAGSVIILISVIGWCTTWFRRSMRRARVFASAVAVLCAASVTITTALATFWIESAQHQDRILAQLSADLPRLDPHSTVLLSGVCPYIGPAIVFESSWDLRGALRILHRDHTLEADVTSGQVDVGDRGVTTRIYQAVVMHRYGAGLFAYDAPTRSVAVLRDQATAQHALAKRDCRGQPGSGALTLPSDRVFGWIESRLEQG